LPEAYKYSTAKFYETNIDDWGFITPLSILIGVRSCCPRTAVGEALLQS
jgi:hypothetical protein